MATRNSDPIAGETALRSKEGAWGVSDDKNNGGSHLRENGKPAGAVPDEHLNACSCAFGHLERIGVLADMDSSPRVLRFYRDGVLMPKATVSGFPETVYIAATPKTKGVKVRLSFPAVPTPIEPSTDDGAAAAPAAAARKGGKMLWKVAATAHLEAAAATERKQSVWMVAQEAVRKRRADFKQNKTPCELEFTEPGPLGIAFGYEGGITWVEAVSRSGMTAKLSSSMERDIEGYVVSTVNGEQPRSFDEIAGQIQSGERPIVLEFTYPTKEEQKVMRSVEKEWIKEDRRGEKVKLQEAKDAAKITKQEMKEEAAAYAHEVKQASKINKETGKLVRGSNERHQSKAKSGWKNLKRKMPEELKKKKKPSLFEMAAQEQANMEALVAKSAPHRSVSPGTQASSLRKDELENSNLQQPEADKINSTGKEAVHTAGLAATRAKSRSALLQGLRDGTLAVAVEMAESTGVAPAAATDNLGQRPAALNAVVEANSGQISANIQTTAKVQNSRLSATRAKSRGALLQGLRTGELAAVVETMEATTTEPATETDVAELRQQLEASQREAAELGALDTS